MYFMYLISYWPCYSYHSLLTELYSPRIQIQVVGISCSRIQAYKHTSPEHNTRYFKAVKILSGKLQFKNKSYSKRAQEQKGHLCSTFGGKVRAPARCTDPLSPPGPASSSSSLASRQFTLHSRPSHSSLFLYAPTSCELKASTKRARDMAKKKKRKKEIKDDF